MSRPVLITALTCPGLAACGGKTPSTTGAVDAASKAGKEAVSGAPQDAASQKFAAALVGLEISDFTPSDSGATFAYTDLDFEPDGTWAAKGLLEASFEKIECAESGSWSMEPAQSATTANVSFTVDQTDCPARESGLEQRMLFTINKDGTFETKFR